mgnify:CR=1 FL=1|tara:strand:- start:117 stop:992 length:876 start_codon:yes stop_codon:yes gene_type:complete
MKYNICVDIGGTTFSFVLYLNNNIEFKSELFNIKDFDEYQKFLSFLTDNIKNIIDENKINNISFACPGPLNSKSGQILNTPNLRVLQYVNLKKEVKKYIKCNNIFVENDANVFALGSYYRLKNKENYILSEKDVLIGITLGTGIGFGIIINNKLFRGSNGFSGEYELSPLYDDITWANLIGYRFFKNKTLHIFNKILSPKELYNLAKVNNANAISIWKEYGNNIGLCISHLIGLINPNYISIGGGISKAKKFFHEDIINTLVNKSITFEVSKVNFLYDTDNLNIYYGGLFL